MHEWGAAILYRHAHFRRKDGEYIENSDRMCQSERETSAGADILQHKYFIMQFLLRLVALLQKLPLSITLQGQIEDKTFYYFFIYLHI